MTHYIPHEHETPIEHELGMVLLENKELRDKIDKRKEIVAEKEAEIERLKNNMAKVAYAMIKDLDADLWKEELDILQDRKNYEQRND